MADRLALAAVAAALVAPFIASADQRPSRADFPIAAMTVVEAEAYAAASALAGAGGAPVEIALASSAGSRAGPSTSFRSIKPARRRPLPE